MIGLDYHMSTDMIRYVKCSVIQQNSFVKEVKKDVVDTIFKVDDLIR